MKSLSSPCVFVFASLCFVVLCPALLCFAVLCVFVINFALLCLLVCFDVLCVCVCVCVACPLRSGLTPPGGCHIGSKFLMRAAVCSQRGVRALDV